MFDMEFLALMWNLARFQSDTKSGRFILPTGRSTGGPANAGDLRRDEGLDLMKFSVYLLI